MGFRRTYTDYIDDVSGRYVDNVQLAFEASPLTAALADRTEYGETSFNADRARGGETRTGTITAASASPSSSASSPTANSSTTGPAGAIERYTSNVSTEHTAEELQLRDRVDRERVPRHVPSSWTAMAAGPSRRAKCGWWATSMG